MHRAVFLGYRPQKILLVLCFEYLIQSNAMLLHIKRLQAVFGICRSIKACSSDDSGISEDAKKTFDLLDADDERFLIKSSLVQCYTVLAVNSQI